MEHLGLRLSTSAAVKEKRLAALRAAAPPDGTESLLRDAVDDAQLLGSLELSGFSFTWDEVMAPRRGQPGPEPIVALRRAHSVLPSAAPFGVGALRQWHGAIVGGEGRLRQDERSRADGPPPAPPELIADRLAALEGWLNVESSRELKPAAQGALVLARVLEILPFDEANGRVARLAASHLMVRAGARPPILVGGDQPRFEHALRSAFALDTEPLCRLLEEASERGLDVMIQTLAVKPRE